MATFLDTSDDVFLEIISYLDIVSTVFLLSTSRRLWRLRSKSVVTDKIVPYHPYIKQRQWNSGLKIAVLKSDIPQLFYFVEKGGDDFNGGLFKAAFTGNKNLVQYFISKGASRWNKAMGKASFGGHMDLVEFFISKGANNWRIGLIEAAKGKHMKLIEYFLQKNNAIYYIDDGLIGAIQSRDKTMMDFFISKGAQDWDASLCAAAKTGDYDLVNFFIDRGAFQGVDAMSAACLGGHKHLAEFFKKKVPEASYVSCCAKACRSGNRDLVESILQDLSRSHIELMLDYCLQESARGGHKHLVDVFIALGSRGWNVGLLGAIRGGHTDLVNFFIQKGACNWDQALIASTEKGLKNMVDRFLDKANPSVLTDAMIEAIAQEDRTLVMYLIEKGANDWREGLRNAAFFDLYDLGEFFVSKLELEKT